MPDPTPPRPRRLVGMSTKMYFTLSQTHTYLATLLTRLPATSPLLSKTTVFLIPDFLSLLPAAALLESHAHPLLLGAQDTHHADSGAFTGEVSPAVLREAGCALVEIGHAERRRLFGETDESTALKAAAAVRNGLIPLVCIGERERGGVEAAVEECRGQVEAVMAAVPGEAEVVLAYEPVWAIGAEEPASKEHVVGVAKGMRRFVEGRKGSVRILYGGSAGPGLFAGLVEGVDGLFLGRFAHDVEAFVRTIEEVANA